MAIGIGNSASRDQTIAVGRSNSFTGYISMAFGANNSVSADNSVTLGNGITNATNGSVQIGTSDASKMTLTSGGALGIGTATPGHKLTVDGGQIQSIADDWAGLELNTNHASAHPYANFTRGRGSRATTVTQPQSGDVLGALYFKDLTRSTATIQVVATENHGASAAGTAMYFQVAPNGSNGYAPPALTIDHNSFVGIGTTAPTAKLDVNGTAAVNSSIEGISSYVATGAAYSIPDTSLNIRRLTLDATTTITLPAFTGPASKMYSMTIFLKQDGSGSHIVTFNGAGSDIVKWDSGTAPTISTTAGKITVIQLMKASDEAVWYGSMVWKEN